MDKTLVDWLHDAITLQSLKSVDGAGEATYAVGKQLACSIQGKQTMVRDDSGNEVVSNWTVYLDSTTDTRAITLKDRLVLPDGRQPPILHIAPYKNERGDVDYIEVYL